MTSAERASLFADRYGPKREQAEKRVYTNDLDALEALIVEGLPADEMQAAAWVLVQRVRGLHDDLNRLQGALVRSRGMKEAVSASTTRRVADWFASWVFALAVVFEHLRRERRKG